MEERKQIAAVDAGPVSGEPDAQDIRAEKYEVQLRDAITGEVLGYGGGDTPEEAAQRAIEDARASHELDEPLATNNEGVRD